MDVGEHLFRRFLRIKQRLAARPPDDLEKAAVALSEISDRLRSLCVLLTGEAIEIKGGSYFDVAAGGIFVFPDRISSFPTTELNTQAYIFRLLFLAQARSMGIHASPDLQGAIEVYVAQIYIAQRVVDELERTYPGARVMREELYTATLSRRAPLRSLDSVADVLEYCCQRRLGGRDDKLLRTISTDRYKTIERILAGQGDDPSDLGKDVLISLRRDFRRRGAERAPVPFWGVPGALALDAVLSTDYRDVRRRPDQKVAAELGRTIHLKHNEPRKANIPIFHAFEKTESIEDYHGESSTPEANDDLTNEEEALRDLKLGSVIRTMDTPSGLLKAEIVGDGTAFHVEAGGPSEGIVTTYPEWDYRAADYRHGWCTLAEVHEPYPDSGGTKEGFVQETIRRNQGIIRDIRNELLRLLAEKTTRNRQLDGSEFDLDALIEWHADTVARRTPPDRLYLSERQSVPDVAILLLFDTSLSTDGWVDGRRVLDVEIESLIILSEAFKGYLDEEVAIAHFNSKTRNACRFSILKSFDETWSRLLATCPALEPAGYTRIGPAIRHAASILEERRARRKFLVVVTDGKPTDYDQYEGRYGVEDTAQAIREARQRRISVFGLAIEQVATHQVAEMFGPNGYKVLPKSALLSGCMADIFIKFLR